MSTREWTFLSNHTHVLVCIARNPAVTMREVADHVGITERAVQRIVRDLVDGGYLTRHRQGRHNVYGVRTERPLRHDVERATGLGALLEVLGATNSTPPPEITES